MKNIKQLSYLTILLAITITVKVIFGMIAGFEIVTSIIILSATILSLPATFIYVCSFNLLILAIYGFGTWWITYWPMWLTIAISTNLLKNIITKNVYLYSLWVGGWAFSIWIWYFIFDWIYFDISYAISMIVSGITFNLIGMTTNIFLSFSIFFSIPILKNQYMKSLKNRY